MPHTCYQQRPSGATGVCVALIMRTLWLKWILILAALLLCRCSGDATHTSVRSMGENVVDLSKCRNLRFGDYEASALRRYLASSERWDVRVYGTQILATNPEAVPGIYNVYYGSIEITDVEYGPSSVRAVISFGPRTGTSRLEPVETLCSAGDDSILLNVNNPRTGRPGYSSHLVVDCGEVFVEIYEDGPQLERIYTQRICDSVFEELTEVAKFVKDVLETGFLPQGCRYHELSHLAGDLRIADLQSLGSYQVDAYVNPTTEGVVFLKVIDVASEKPVEIEQQHTVRCVGWSPTGSQFFHYDCEVFLGDGITGVEPPGYGPHRPRGSGSVRFEVWHRSLDNKETKLCEAQHMATEWQR